MEEEEGDSNGGDLRSNFDAATVVGSSSSVVVTSKAAGCCGDDDDEAAQQRIRRLEEEIDFLRLQLDAARRAQQRQRDDDGNNHGSQTLGSKSYNGDNRDDDVREPGKRRPGGTHDDGNGNDDDEDGVLGEHSPPFAGILRPDQIERYSRQLLIHGGFGVEGQVKLLKSSVLVVGAGGIGSTGKASHGGTSTTGLKAGGNQRVGRFVLGTLSFTLTSSFRSVPDSHPVLGSLRSGKTYHRRLRRSGRVQFASAGHSQGTRCGVAKDGIGTTVRRRVEPHRVVRDRAKSPHDGQRPRVGFRPRLRRRRE
jgi:hypothetical protein